MKTSKLMTLMGDEYPPKTYFPSGWDTAWKTARDASASSPAWMAFSGDSTMQGGQCSDAMTTSYPRLLEASLVGSYGLYADCYSPVYDPAAVAINFTGAPWTRTLNGATATLVGRTFGPVIEFSGGTPVQTFTAPYACTQVDVNYRDISTGTFRIQINGANAGSTAALPYSVGSISQSYAGGVLTITVTNQNALVRRRIMITSLDNTAHVVTIDQQSGASQQAIPGVSVFNSTTGIGFYHGACSGFRSSSYAGGWETINEWSWRGHVDAGHTTGAGFPAQPHLICLQYGINECAAGLASVSISAFKTAMEIFIKGVRAGQTNASILIIGYVSPGSGSDTLAGNRWGNYVNWPQFLRAMYDLSIKYSCGFLNLHRIWNNGLDLQTTGYVSSNNLHPTDAGNDAIYDLIRPLL